VNVLQVKVNVLIGESECVDRWKWTYWQVKVNVLQVKVSMVQIKVNMLTGESERVDSESKRVAG